MKRSHKYRWFASHDEALQKGTFRKVIYEPAWMRGESIYAEGSFVTCVKAQTHEECDAISATRLACKMREYSKERFKALAPDCCQV